MTARPVRREDLISRQAAAELLKVHPNTSDRWLAEHGAQKYRIRGDGRIFYLRTAVAACADPIIEVA